MITAVLVGLVAAGFFVVVGVLLTVVDHRARVSGFEEGRIEGLCEATSAIERRAQMHAYTSRTNKPDARLN